LGSRWTRLPGSGAWLLVPDEEERALMRAMLRWHVAGHSVDMIRQHVQYTLKVAFTKESGGRRRPVSWGRDNIWRRIEAARRLREQGALEAPADTTAEVAG